MNNRQIVDVLSERWIKSGLEKGDIFLLHSNIRRLLLEFKEKKIKLDVKIIINSFLDTIGENGTLLMPLFNFECIKKNFFSLKKTKSQMGILTESFRMNYQILRTKHPVYSFAVFGKNIEKFEVDNFSAYGENSPFDILRKMNGKIAILDLEDQNSMTFYHHIEEMNNVDWRYHKTFTGMYEDFEGNLYEKEYSIYVRNLKKKIITQVNPAGKLLWSNGLYKGSLPNTGYGLRVLNTIDVYEFISKIILDGKAKGVLYNQT